jgi:trehalose-phosphatase
LEFSVTNVLKSPICLLGRLLPDSKLKNRILNYCKKTTEVSLKVLHKAEEDFEKAAQEIEKILSLKKTRVWFFDLDGTLAEGYDSQGEKLPSDEKFISPRALKVLKKIADSPNDQLIFISGRYYNYLVNQIKASLERAGMEFDDFKTPTVHFIGSYGLEIDSPADPSVYGVMSSRLKEIFSQKIAQKVKSYLNFSKAKADGMPNIWFKEKPTGVVIHCEECLKNIALLERVHKIAQETVDEFNKNSEVKFITYSGSPELIDLKPIHSNKGLAFQEMMKRYPNSIPIGAGNERADLEFLSKIEGKGVPIFIGSQKSEYPKVFNLTSVKRLEELLERISPKL